MQERLTIIVALLCGVAAFIVGGNLAKYESQQPIRITSPAATYRLLSTDERTYLKGAYESEIGARISGDYTIAACIEQFCLDHTIGHFESGVLTQITLESGETVTSDRFDTWNFPDEYPQDAFNEAFELWLIENDAHIDVLLKEKDAQ